MVWFSKHPLSTKLFIVLPLLPLCYLSLWGLLVCYFSGHIFGFFSFPRLNNVEEFTRATIKKLTQGMAENNKSMADAKTDEEKEKIVSFILCLVISGSCLSLDILVSC